MWRQVRNPVQFIIHLAELKADGSSSFLSWFVFYLGKISRTPRFYLMVHPRVKIKSICVISGQTLLLYFVFCLFFCKWRKFLLCLICSIVLRPKSCYEGVFSASRFQIQIPLIISKFSAKELVSYHLVSIFLHSYYKTYDLNWLQQRTLVWIFKLTGGSTPCLI
jgi:hypothetical protein